MNRLKNFFIKKPVKIISSILYCYILRNYIKTFINDDNKTWDDNIIKALDEIFEYKKG